MIIRGYNDFYEGWLAFIFGKLKRDASGEWRDGWFMAQDTITTDKDLLRMIRVEILNKHIIVEE